MLKTASQTDSQGLLDRLASSLPAMVLSGAGISVSTGIPTYRDERGTWLRSQPITHQEFVGNPRQRQRYWGRSLLGWPGVREARPAAAHRALVQLESQGHVSHVVTQNVDRLHQRAGSVAVTDLHGRLDRVRCLDCGALSSRDLLQSPLERMNPEIRSARADVRPDGDADLPEDLVTTVQVPACADCAGTLMPDVVFFGGSIPKERVDATREALAQSRCLLVVGSSLQVYSGFRYCRWAQQNDKPIFIMNPGVTRADDLAECWRESADSALGQLCEFVGKDSRIDVNKPAASIDD